jgi:hypothetical protein
MYSKYALAYPHQESQAAATYHEQVRVEYDEGRADLRDEVRGCAEVVLGEWWRVSNVHEVVGRFAHRAHVPHADEYGCDACIQEQHDSAGPRTPLPQKVDRQRGHHEVGACDRLLSGAGS